MQRQISSFIKEISNAWNPLQESLVKEIISQFQDLKNVSEINFNDSEDYKINDIPATFGIYCFYIKFSKPMGKSDFKKLWGKDIMDKQPKVSLMRLREFEKDKWDDYNEWKVLYIGKSENLNERVHQHLNLKVTSTSALKLKRRASLNKIASYKVVYYSLEDLDKKLDKSLIQFVITNLESKIRNKIEPIIGKQ